MTEQDIINLIKEDKLMMDILRVAESLDLPDWLIGAGFVRNKVWNYLHEFDKSKIDTADIDLVYFDPNGNDEATDKKLSEKLKQQTGIEWEIVNQAYANKWNKLTPYQSTEDAIAQWPETATAVGVRLKNQELGLVAPYGIEDLINMIIRQSPRFHKKEVFQDRMTKKRWQERWPKVKIIL